MIIPTTSVKRVGNKHGKLTMVFSKNGYYFRYGDYEKSSSRQPLTKGWAHLATVAKDEKRVKLSKISSLSGKSLDCGSF